MPETMESQLRKIVSQLSALADTRDIPHWVSDDLCLVHLEALKLLDRVQEETRYTLTEKGERHVSG